MLHQTRDRAEPGSFAYLLCPELNVSRCAGAIEQAWPCARNVNHRCAGVIGTSGQKLLDSYRPSKRPELDKFIFKLFNTCWTKTVPAVARHVFIVGEHRGHATAGPAQWYCIGTASCSPTSLHISALAIARCQPGQFDLTAEAASYAADLSTQCGQTHVASSGKDSGAREGHSHACRFVCWLTSSRFFPLSGFLC